MIEQRVRVGENSMQADSQLYLELVNELRLASNLQPNEISILVKDGVVILTGCTDSAYKKYTAEQVAKRIAGLVGLSTIFRCECQGPGSALMPILPMLLYRCWNGPSTCPSIGSKSW